MWIFTQAGHFSIVKDAYCEDGELMVRSRVEADLQRLIKGAYKSVDSTLPKILTISHADYRFRAKFNAQVLAAHMFSEVFDINYPTVKDNIMPKEPAKTAYLRKTAYYGVWGSMVNFQDSVHGK